MPNSGGEIYLRGVIKTKPEYACKFVIFVIQELLTKDQIFRWPLSTNFILINFLSENLLTKQIVWKKCCWCNPYRFWACFLLHFVVSLVKASLKALEMQFFIGQVYTIWPLGKPALRMVSCLINPRKIPVVRERL